MTTPRFSTVSTSILLALAVATTSSLAFADDEDKAACANLEEGDECTRGDGDPGFCIPDDSDPNILTCDDDTSGIDDSADGDGCSVGGHGAPSPSSLIPLGLAMWWLRRRRR